MQFDETHQPWQNTLTEQNIHIVGGAANNVLKAGNKWELMASLRTALCQREKLDAVMCAEIEHELMEREKLMSTGIGEQMAIPHAVVPSACKFMTECAILPDGIDFESIDSTPAYIVVMLVAPKSALGEHLKVMASIAKVFYSAETRKSVISAQTPAAALAAIKAATP